MLKLENKDKKSRYFSGKVPFCDSFGSVAEGEPLLMVSETLQIQIAINYENMSEKYGIQVGPNWTIEMELCEKGVNRYEKPTIVMQSDFGIDSGLVACMHGMCRLVDFRIGKHRILLI